MVKVNVLPAFCGLGTIAWKTVLYDLTLKNALDLERLRGSHTHQKPKPTYIDRDSVPYAQGGSGVTLSASCKNRKVVLSCCFSLKIEAQAINKASFLCIMSRKTREKNSPAYLFYFILF